MTKNICHAGDIILHKGKHMEVAQIICQGERGEKRKTGRSRGIKAVISAFTIMSDNEQVLRRSPHYIGENWTFVKSGSRKEKWSGKHDHCVECHTIERKHRGRGLCHSCYGVMLRGGIRTKRDFGT